MGLSLYFSGAKTLILQRRAKDVVFSNPVKAEVVRGIRPILQFGVAIIAVAMSLWVCAWLFRSDLTDRPLPYTAHEIEEGRRAFDVSFDANRTPTMYVKAAVTPAGQSPVLQDLERTGKLPPLKDRLPLEPAVMTGTDGIGNYGGTWMRIANSADDVSIINYRLSGPFLVRWSPLGYPVEPHIAKSVVSSADKREWTVTLRKGMKWSDGAPFTADDILYWWRDEVNNKTLTSTAPPWMLQNGKPGRVEKIDEVTVRFSFDEPYALFLEVLASKGEPCDTPAHYLRQFHPDPAIGNRELIDREMRAYKLPSPRALYSFIKAWQNPELPRLWPWIYRSYKGNPPQVFVRNPYYFVVDPAGNQLPYIDRVQFDVQDSRLLVLTAANGGVSMQGRHMRFTDYTELMTRRENAGTKIYNWYPATRSNWAINPNLTRRIDPNDPKTKWKSDLLSNKKFRQALSIAIDRKKIVRAEQAGVGEPSQVEPGADSPFHSEKLAKAFIEYDPGRASRMLDELGLNQRDSEGYRTFSNGERMTFYLDYVQFIGLGAAQFIVDDWGAVGIRLIVRERARALFYTEKDSAEFDFNVWSSESDYMPLLSPRYFIPFTTESFYATGWARWYQRGGFFGNPNANIKSAIPVPTDHPMYESIRLYEQALKTPDPAEQKRLMSRVLEIAAENTWTINIATAPPVPMVLDKTLRNVPKNALWGVIFSTPSNAGIETYYFDAPRSSPGAIEELKSAIITPTLRPGATGTTPRTWAGATIRSLVWAIPLLFLGMIAVRHPFIGRRVLIMVPTLFVISIIVFTIIQLPPGDFLTTKIMQLQESGDPANDQAIKDTRELFHYNDPAWKLYLRWMGLQWFVTFEPADEGLLQGNLGRSMETQQPINTVVGDRIVLTVVISLATILFTWAVALPIGIYSAVRQYSMGDYALTLVGFVGMCVPSFLLALVLMAISGVSGLFSPEFAAQPEWSWAKVADLMKHIWIPVIVLGVGGTAGMIRVMRANLLDELKKAYVITAMAKGVRPTKLLLKYPVRLALNPFISGIGGYFPQLVSGGAIVSMVLSLPMVGPLLLTALQTQDMYLAGSMLMVLSLLGVVGTLVSDLLLLWLDPRIRFEGGSR